MATGGAEVEGGGQRDLCRARLCRSVSGSDASQCLIPTQFTILHPYSHFQRSTRSSSSVYVLLALSLSRLSLSLSFCSPHSPHSHRLGSNRCGVAPGEAGLVHPPPSTCGQGNTNMNILLSHTCTHTRAHHLSIPWYSGSGKRSFTPHIAFPPATRWSQSIHSLVGLCCPHSLRSPILTRSARPTRPSSLAPLAPLAHPHSLCSPIPTRSARPSSLALLAPPHSLHSLPRSSTRWYARPRLAPSGTRRR